MKAISQPVKSIGVATTAHSHYNKDNKRSVIMYASFKYDVKKQETYHTFSISINDKYDIKDIHIPVYEDAYDRFVEAIKAGTLLEIEEILDEN